MSAGVHGSTPTVNKDLTILAPKFRVAVESALAECGQKGLDAIVFEAFRSDELQRLYFARGRTVIPPVKTVTNARTNLESWHGYSLAVDVIHRTKFWNAPESFFAQVAEVFGRHDCKWGGNWRMRDLPHFQWARCKPSPSQTAITIARTEGVEAVWRVVGAI
jgi:peptidoglycan L-alanyl-D-glutamate endopeptidase CwlK